MLKTQEPGLNLFHRGPYLSATTADRSHVTVKPVWAAPLSQPGKYLAFLNESGEEVALLENPDTFAKDSRAALDEELRRRYLTATITRVVSVDVQHGPVYITAETDRGETTFLVQHLQDNAIWFSDTHLLLIDTDTNRFEIPNLRALDERSRALLHNIL